MYRKDSTVQDSNVQYSTTQYNTVQYSTVQYSYLWEVWRGLVSYKYRGVKEKKKENNKEKMSIWRPMGPPPGTMGKNMTDRQMN